MTTNTLNPYEAADIPLEWLLDEFDDIAEWLGHCHVFLQQSLKPEVPRSLYMLKHHHLKQVVAAIFAKSRHIKINDPQADRICACRYILEEFALDDDNIQNNSNQYISYSDSDTKYPDLKLIRGGHDRTS